MSYQYNSINNNPDLIRALEDTKLMDETKAFFHKKLYESLQNQSTAYSQGFPRTTTQQFKSNPNNITNKPLIKLGISLIYDFLTKLNLNHTLSTLQAEGSTLLNASYPYTESDLLTLLNMDVTLFNEFQEETRGTFLCQLLREKSKYLKEETSCQTEINLINNPLSALAGTGSSSDLNPKYMSLEEKLQSIDQKYNSKLNIESLIPTKLYEAKYIKFKTETEAKLKEDYESQLKRFKDVELCQMRQEELKKYNSKLQQIRDEYENEYKKKDERLKAKEKELNERISNREKEIEMELHKHRQEQQSKLELLRMKENEIEKSNANERNKIQIELDKIKQREREAEFIKENALNKIKSEVDQYKFDYDKKLADEKREFENEKKNFRTQNASQLSLVEKLNAKEKECSDLQIKNTKLKNEINQIRNSYDMSMKDNDNLRNQLNTMDIQNKSIVNQLSRKDYEFDNLKNEIKNLNKTIDNQQRATAKQYDSYQHNVSNSMGYNNNTTNNNNNAELERKIRQMEKTVNQYKDMCNKLLSERNKNNNTNTNTNSNRHSEHRNSNNNNAQLSKQRTVPQPYRNINNVYASKRFLNYPDRKAVLAQLEEEQFKLNKEMRDEFRNLTSLQQIPVTVMSQEEIKEYKRCAYNNIVLLNEDKEKQIHDYYEKNPLKDNETHSPSPMEHNINQNGVAHSNIVPSKPKPQTQTQVAPAITSSTSYVRKSSDPSSLRNNNANNNKKDSITNISSSSIKKQKSSTSPHQYPTPKIVSNTSYHKQNSLHNSNRSNDNLVNDYDDNNNKERIPTPKHNSIKDQQQGSKISSRKQNQTSHNDSIREEINDSRSHSHGKNNNKDDDYNNNNKNSTKLPPVNISRHTSSSQNKSNVNKFQNIDYENKPNIENDYEEEDYGGFEDNVDGLIDKKNSIDLDAIQHSSIGHRGIGVKGNTNFSVSSIHNKSANSGNIEKFLQSNNKVSHIEEEINEENSNENKDSKKGQDDVDESEQYNDFVVSNAMSSKKGIVNASSGNYYGSSAEIKEEIVRDYDDDDGYNPY